METTTKQDRITLKNLKVAEFASEETLCFTATVLFDNIPIAQASNEGHGGSTFLRMLEGKKTQLSEAREYIKRLPPRTDNNVSRDGTPFTFNLSLEDVVDEQAYEQHEDRRLRRTYSRHIKSKVLFIKDGQLLYEIGIKPKSITDHQAYFATLYKRHGESIIILAELPPEAAFALWKLHI